MKKFVAMMVTVVMMLMAGNGLATESTVMPKVYLNDLEHIVWNDDYDFHIVMYMSMPENENVRLEMSISFDDNEWQNYNHGITKFFDNNTGELIDEIGGNLCDEVDCSSRDVETVRRNMMTYIDNYDFESDAEKGLRYYSIWF